MSELRVAVVGAGILGRRHARVFTELEGARLVAVASRTLEQAQAVAGGYGARPFADVQRMLDEVPCDVVAVATPDHLHGAPVLAALERGRHVLVEKPLATTLPEARAMTAEAERRNLVLQVNYSQRFVPEYAWIKQRIDAGAIGRPLMALSSKQDTIFVPTRMISWAAQTSPILFMSSHDLDLVAWFFGARAARVTAHETRGVLESMGIAAHDGVDAIVVYDTGATLSCHSSWIHPNSWPQITTDRMTIIGETGVIHHESTGRRVQCYTKADGHTETFTGPQTATEVDGRIQGAFRASLEMFCRSVRDGSVPDTAALRTLHVTETQLAILEAARTGEWILLEGALR